MTGGRARSLLQVALLHLLYRASLGFEPTLLERNITSDDIFLKFSNVYAKTQPARFKQDNISFTAGRQTIPEPGNLTLDEKCRRGLPLSVSWTSYGPYASLLRSTNHPKKSGVALVGIFPHVINKVLSRCCHQDTRVQTGEFISTLKSLEKSLSSRYSYDMTFPVGLQSMSMTVFKDLAVVPLLRAPRTTLFVPEISEKSGKTFELFRTVGLAWPILVFIFLAAVLSGVFIWILDHIKNPDEFPTTFVSGVWEGFWWAVVTMTTVGYGDRAPRSILGRLFCIIWIVIGMSIIAIFTAMITASLSASIQYRFVVHGSVMGAVAGSQEERIGTGMNADIQTFKTPDDVVKELVDTSELEVAIMDNYLLSYYADVIRREPVRVYSNLEQPINYGFVLGPHATNFSECFRRFVRNNPQQIFDIIRKNLNPLKNPTDDISEEVKASQGFLGEEAFHMILYGLVGAVVVFFLLGLIWEYCISKIICGGRGERRENENEEKPPRKTFLQSLIGFRLSQNSGTKADDIRHLETIKHRSTRIRQLVREYDEFYESWIEKLRGVTDGEEWRKLRGVTDGEEWRGFNEKPSNAKNASFLMVTYNGNN